MNLQHLRYFLAVARNGGFTQAAREMHVTQPTVSSGVADLERSLGVQLFNRDSRHVALTTEGRLLLSYAVQIEDLLEEAGERLERRDLEPGEGFQFGAIDAAVIYLLIGNRLFLRTAKPIYHHGLPLFISAYGIAVLLSH